MPQIAVHSSHNGTAAVSFAPSKHTYENGYQVVEYLQNTTGLAAILRAKIRVEFAQPRNGKNGKLRFSVMVPTQETVSGTSDQGYVAPPKIAFRDAFRGEYDIPERSSAASRAVLQSYLHRLTAVGSAVAVGDTALTGITPGSQSLLANVVNSLEGFY